LDGISSNFFLPFILPVLTQPFNFILTSFQGRTGRCGNAVIAAGLFFDSAKHFKDIF
jgi:hypothetical protein